MHFHVCMSVLSLFYQSWKRQLMRKKRNKELIKASDQISADRITKVCLVLGEWETSRGRRDLSATGYFSWSSEFLVFGRQFRLAVVGIHMLIGVRIFCWQNRRIKDTFLSSSLLSSPSLLQSSYMHRLRQSVCVGNYSVTISKHILRL